MISTRKNVVEGFLAQKLGHYSQYISVSFGQELYRFREISGLKQSEAARKSGLTRGYYGELENSRRPPPPKRTIERIAHALELTVEQQHRLLRLAHIEREKENISLGKSEILDAVLTDLTFKADRLSTNHIQRIVAILEEVPGP